MERSITLAGETYRLTYNVTTSLRIIETARPDKNIMQLVDSRRMDDRVLLILAGLDETHQKDKKKRITSTDINALAETIYKAIEAELEALAQRPGENTLDHVLMPMQQAIGESGIAGAFWTYESPFVAVALGKEPTTTLAAS